MSLYCIWTNRIREGTIRAELADAINDTAGVVLAVLHGKWDSVAHLPGGQCRRNLDPPSAGLIHNNTETKAGTRATKKIDKAF